MSNGTGRFMYAGHAMGIAAQFHRLDPLTNLNHVIPTQGSSVLAVTGGRSESHVPGYRYDVDQPRGRCLVAVDSIDTWVEGREQDGSFLTETSVTIAGLNVLEKLHIDRLQVHMLSTTTGTGDPVVTTEGNRIDGMRLGNVQVKVTLDDTPLCKAGSADQLAAHFQGLGQPLTQSGGYSICTLVRDIQLIGSDRDKQGMTVDGNAIEWEGDFGMGRIILGEIHVKGHDRRLTLVRLDMGSDAGGTGTAGDAQSNGTPIIG